MAAGESGSAVTVTSDAAKRIAFLMQQESTEAKLRVEVQGGGCSGFSYGFRFD
ncbi:MAG: iron-sulfur cluster assembly accessory protein, partial [Alphaproteobacteria bacterium]|nr:iron-sulfur cluster assembly accessory protein [Alphaproteobacteria bacterium]